MHLAIHDDLAELYHTLHESSVVTVLEPASKALIIMTLVVLVITLALNICLRHIGVGYRPLGEDDGLIASLLVRCILIVSYSGLFFSTMYAWIYGLWPSKAYYLVMTASFLSTVWVLLAWFEPELDDEEEYVGRFITKPCVLEVIRWAITLALTIVLYNLWWIAYWPLGDEQRAASFLYMLVRNLLGFYLGWSLLVSVTLGVFIVDVVRLMRMVMLAASVVVLTIVVVILYREIRTMKPLIGLIAAGVIGLVSLTGSACMKS